MLPQSKSLYAQLLPQPNLKFPLALPLPQTKPFKPKQPPHCSLPIFFKQENKAKTTMDVARGVDLRQYTGRWYEIASIYPTLFQPKNGENTRATYTLRGDDGTLNLLHETFSDGKWGTIEGTVYKADPLSDEAKLKAKVYVPPLLPIIPVAADYWVLFVDEDYQYAMVGQPTRTCLWILSRQPHLDEEIYKQLVERAKDEDYDVTKLHKTPQRDPPPEGEEDIKGVWWFKSILQ